MASNTADAEEVEWKMQMVLGLSCVRPIAGDRGGIVINIHFTLPNKNSSIRPGVPDDDIRALE